MAELNFDAFWKAIEDSKILEPKQQYSNNCSYCSRPSTNRTSCEGCGAPTNTTVRFAIPQVRPGRGGENPNKPAMPPKRICR